MSDKKYYIRKGSSGAYVELVGRHESGDALLQGLFYREDDKPFRVHHYEFEKEWKEVTEAEIEALERQSCPRRLYKGMDYWYVKDGQRRCSYCGSLHPDDLLTLLKEEGLEIIELTTKGYKWYVSSVKGHFKYYRPHDTDALVTYIKELLEKKENDQVN